MDLAFFWGANATQTTGNNGSLMSELNQTCVAGAANNQYETFSYDGVDRLMQFTDNGGGQSVQSMVYDQYGNMALDLGNSSGTLPVSPQTPAPRQIDPATNRLTTAGAAYDGVGNLIAVGSPALTASYDAENRQIAAGTGAQTAYAYDGNGQRVSKVSAGVTTVFVYDAQGQMAAEYSTAAASAPCATCYLSWDHLGSTRMVTDQSGTVVERHDYMPFGEEILSGYAGRTNLWGGTDNVNQKFTGKERDAESGLDYFGARYYGSGLGRFTGPDRYNAMLIRQNMVLSGLPEAAATSFFNDFLENPQNWNQYAYVRNTPLRLTDPTGAAPAEGHHLITGRQILTSPLAQEFTNAIKTGPLSGNGFPNQKGFNTMHRAYNAAIENLLQEAEQTSGDRNTWSLSQWTSVAKQILDSDESAIKDFLDELEANNAGAKAALVTAISSYRVSASVALRVATSVIIDDLGSMLRTPLMMMVDPKITQGPMKEQIKKSHSNCLIDRSTGSCRI